MIVNANEQKGFQSEYLLLDKDGNRIKNDAINNVLRRLNRMIGTTQKGNHSIRKTCISNMGETKALTDEEIRVFAGHKDFTTTEKYYMHTTTSIENRSDAYEKAINSKITNVFKLSDKKSKETLVFIKASSLFNLRKMGLEPQTIPKKAHRKEISGALTWGV